LSEVGGMNNDALRKLPELMQQGQLDLEGEGLEA
jgi:hypothetical protein